MDELWSGVAVVAAPAVEASHGLGHDGYTLWVFALPLFLSASIEAPLAFFSDSVGRRKVLVTGMVALAGALALGALARGPWLFALALALAGAASGAACAAAQGDLVAQPEADGEQLMARWSAWAALGDTLVPLFVALISALGFDYRAALLALGLVVLAHASALSRVSHPSSGPIAEPAEPPTLRGLLAAARMPRLWGLLAASSACCLLDEVVVALAALRFRLDLHASLGTTALGSTLLALGSLAGALATERALRRVRARTILMLSCVTCLVALVGLVISDDPALALALLTLIGVSAAPHHALLQAAAYQLLPGAPGLVNAAIQPFVLLEVGFPLLAGVVAERYGLACALLALAAQPLLVLLAALLCLRARRVEAGVRAGAGGSRWG